MRLDPRTRRRDDGATLLGGSPLRLVRLAPRAQQLLADDRLVVTDAGTATLAARLLDGGLAHPDLLPGVDRLVTIVVPVKDRTDGVARLLDALRADPDTAGLPVLVVDDGSADPAALAAVVRERGGRVLRHDRSRGPAAARNAGLAEADTELVAFLDSDCVPLAGWLPVLTAHLADPRLAVVAPRIVALEGGETGWLSRYEALASALDMGAHPAGVALLSSLSYVPSAALLARRSALGPGFEESMHVAEDVDLVWRLLGAGWRVRYEPSAAVAHQHPAGTGDWLRRRAFYGTGAADLARRHPGAVAPVVLAPWVAVVLGLPLVAGRRGAAAAVAVLAGRTVLLARRLTPTDGRPPLGLAARLTVRGTAAGARSLARSLTRHHWPLAVALLPVSRRARRVAAGVAATDALLSWLPHRRQVGLLRWSAGRRLDDLAYGAGLWAGAIRAREAGALLPVRPPSA